MYSLSLRGSQLRKVLNKTESLDPSHPSRISPDLLRDADQATCITHHPYAFFSIAGSNWTRRSENNTYKIVVSKMTQYSCLLKPL